jgi:hypothetical protein
MQKKCLLGILSELPACHRVCHAIRVDALPVGLKAGDGRSFDFLPRHIPLEDCGAHSVVACAESADATKSYVKPSAKVINDFKVKFALGLKLAYSLR